MEILFLTQIVPFPPNAGARVKTYNVLKFLHSKGHQIDLISLYRDEEKVHLAEMEKFCRSVQGVHIKRNIIETGLKFIKYFLTDIPLLVGRDDFAEMREKVSSAINQNNYDILHADQLSMAQFFLEYSSIPRVFDAHNATWLILERSVEKAYIFLKPILSREAAKTKQYEEMIISEFNHTFTVTQKDADFFLDGLSDYKEKYENRITAVPITVDPGDYPKKEIRLKSNKTLKLLTLGTLNYLPNGDGVIWFVEEVFPLILKEMKDCELTILGKKPPAKLIELADDFGSRIQLMGYVPSLDPYFEEAELLVVPVRYGGGMRVRIIEGWARKIPILTTTVGIEGIDAQNHVHAEIHDDPQAFADAALNLHGDWRNRKLL